jgi:ATP-dependent DNA helicase RecG
MMFLASPCRHGQGRILEGEKMKTALKNRMKDLNVILSNGENYKVEFKETPDKSLASEVCAFANATGGRVFIGVNDNGEITGTDVSNSARSRVQDTINQIESKINVNISIHKNIMIVTVPEGKNKPYSCARGFYLRSGPDKGGHWKVNDPHA